MVAGVRRLQCCMRDIVVEVSGFVVLIASREQNQEHTVCQDVLPHC